jgi:predicted RNA-binding Zn-ribbon protein involved in translation (DUF1610 family)
MFTNLNYIPRGAGMMKAAKAYLGYIGTRPNKAQQKMERLLFGHGGTFTPEQVDEMLRTAPKNTYFWRLIISPDPKTENLDRDLDLWDLTREAVRWLEHRLGTDGTPREIPFIAAEHTDHSNTPHVQGILLIKRQGREMLITQEILNDFREAVAAQAAAQRGARDQGAEVLLEQSSLQQDALLQAAGSTLVSEATILEQGTGASLATTELGLTCPMCSQGVFARRRNSNVYACSVCGYAVRRGVVLRKSREVGWSR